jgi:hypothetical protein
MEKAPAQHELSPPTGSGLPISPLHKWMISLLHQLFAVSLEQCYVKAMCDND